MSKKKYLYEAKRWHQTASEDLTASKALLQSGHYAQACFYTQQCAEKAVKALWLMLGEDPWGHSIQKLIQDFPRKELLEEYDLWVQFAAYLDKFYIPTRYPNGLPDLTPGQVYRLEEAQQAIEKAEYFVRQSERLLERAS
ncbi:MAG: HEPN domain-containing protein [Anaerolineales bacterium]|nr:HEPN domain-containing protein [Anaerolineales bacterium]MCS7249130.1 HEPN domain-containing protein [Anaerolineales bacterium]MDW8162943.1 HEPN domain-containing protein [Anaerolineales bacterium]MDW8447749.1 HEPN domain-containing protein [Anaerolineales bacterium]